MRYFLRLAYDGTDFHGWQRQPNACSVQQSLEESLSVIFQKETLLTGAGRTDSGVHASCMFAHFDSEEIINDKKRFLASLNRLSGQAISIYEVMDVVPDAHARFDALSRTYKYFISLKKDPFRRKFSHRMDRMPDVDKMNEAAETLLGIDDFTSFAKLHTDNKTNICKLTKALWTYEPQDDLLVFEIRADRFLRNMVRAVVGTLLEVGNGKITLSEFKEIIEKKDRCAAGVSMPAKGLFLTDIRYPEEIFIL